METKIKVCSLFSGCGGLDIGFVRAGFEIVYAIDSYARACESYRLNLGLPIVQENILDISVEDIPECYLIVGGFPCQGFSTAGWFKKEDARNELYVEMLKIIQAKQPKVFIAENVMGLLYMENGKVLRYIMNDFRKLGYKVSYITINCADYGVPQQRKRIFILGAKPRFGLRFPFPTHLKNPKGSLFPHLKRWKTVRQAIGDLEGLKDPFPKGRINNVQSRYKVKPDEPSRYTILASSTKIPIHYNGSLEDEFPRRLTIRECARLQSFPDDFQFCGPLTAQIKQIGNAVPPLVSYRLAQAIKASI